MCPKLSLFILLTCFFMHASYSRHLSLTSYKDFHKLSHKRIGLNLSSNPRGTIDSKKMIIKENQLALCKINKGNRGNGDGKACLHKITLENATKQKGSKWRQLMNVKENVFETDYQPPRPKSPIHN